MHLVGNAHDPTKNTPITGTIAPDLFSTYMSHKLSCKFCRRPAVQVGDSIGHGVPPSNAVIHHYSLPNLLAQLSSICTGVKTSSWGTLCTLPRSLPSARPALPRQLSCLGRVATPLLPGVPWATEKMAMASQLQITNSHAHYWYGQSWVSSSKSKANFLTRIRTAGSAQIFSTPLVVISWDHTRRTAGLSVHNPMHFKIPGWSWAAGMLTISP